MKKMKRQSSNKNKRCVSCYVLYQDPKQLKRIESEIIAPIQKAFKTGRLVWPEAPLTSEKGGS